LVLFSKAQALNLAPYPKPSFKPGIDDILFPYFQIQAFSSSQNFQNIKTTNNLIIKELRNPDSPPLNGDT